MPKSRTKSAPKRLLHHVCTKSVPRLAALLAAICACTGSRKARIKTGRSRLVECCPSLSAIGSDRCAQAVRKTAQTRARYRRISVVGRKTAQTASRSDRVSLADGTDGHARDMPTCTSVRVWRYILCSSTCASSFCPAVFGRRRVGSALPGAAPWAREDCRDPV